MKISLNQYIGRAFSTRSLHSESKSTGPSSETMSAVNLEAKKDSVELTLQELKRDGLLTQAGKRAGRAGKAFLKPIVGFAKRTTVDTLATAALSTAVAAGTLGAVSVVGPLGLLVPVVAGTAAGLASREVVSKAYKSKKEARFQALGTGVAVAGMAYGALIGGPALAGVSALAAGTGAIYGLGNSLMVQAMEVGGVINKT